MQKILLNILILFSVCCFAYGQSEELIIKSAYLEKFAMFTEWPSKNTEERPAEFIISIMDDRNFFEVVKNFYSNHNIRNRKVVVNFLEKDADFKNCDLLFISNVKKSKLLKILEATKKLPILTVSDSPGFAEEGVLINLYLDDNKIRFEINEKAIDESSLVISYHLLKYARIVGNTER